MGWPWCFHSACSDTRTRWMGGRWRTGCQSSRHHACRRSPTRPTPRGASQGGRTACLRTLAYDTSLPSWQPVITFSVHLLPTNFLTPSFPPLAASMEQVTLLVERFSITVAIWFLDFLCSIHLLVSSSGLLCCAHSDPPNLRIHLFTTRVIMDHL